MEEKDGVDKTIYDLKLHEWKTISETSNTKVQVMRVPGGWIYATIGLELLSSIFVPYNKEYKGK